MFRNILYNSLETFLIKTFGKIEYQKWVYTIYIVYKANPMIHSGKICVLAKVYTNFNGCLLELKSEHNHEAN